MIKKYKKQNKQIDRKAQSNILVNVLVVAISIVALALVWTYISYSLNASGKQISANLLDNLFSQAASSFCVDSDGGLDYYVKGVVNTSTRNYTDSCTGKILTEYYCNAKKMVSNTYNCSNECTNGACVNVSVNSINSCKTISVSGSYNLINNIGSGGTCLIINASDVVINGNGHTITGNVFADGINEGDNAFTNLVLNSIIVNGTISANGANTENYDGGAGGSITLTNSTITTISSNGGYGGYTGGSGGVIIITSSNTTNVNAKGGDVYYGSGGAGIGGSVTFTNSKAILLDVTGGRGFYGTFGGNGGSISLTNSNVTTISSNGGGGDSVCGNGGTITLTNSLAGEIYSKGGNADNGGTGGNGGTVTFSPCPEKLPNVDVSGGIGAGGYSNGVAGTVTPQACHLPWANGLFCSNGGDCESGYCDSYNYVCADREVAYCVDSDAETDINGNTFGVVLYAVNDCSGSLSADCLYMVSAADVCINANTLAEQKCNNEQHEVQTISCSNCKNGVCLDVGPNTPCSSFADCKNGKYIYCDLLNHVCSAGNIGDSCDSSVKDPIQQSGQCQSWFCNSRNQCSYGYFGDYCASNNDCPNAAYCDTLSRMCG